MRGVTLMSHHELQKLTDLQVVFIGQKLGHGTLPRKSTMRTLRDDLCSSTTGTTNWSLTLKQLSGITNSTIAT